MESKVSLTIRRVYTDDDSIVSGMKDLKLTDRQPISGKVIFIPFWFNGLPTSCSTPHLPGSISHRDMILLMFNFDNVIHTVDNCKLEYNDIVFNVGSIAVVLRPAKPTAKFTDKYLPDVKHYIYTKKSHTLKLIMEDIDTWKYICNTTRIFVDKDKLITFLSVADIISGLFNHYTKYNL